MASQPLHIRLDDETNAKIEAFMKSNEMTRSQAVRMLLATALREAEPADKTWLRQAFREGLIEGQRKIRSKLGAAIDAALSEFEG